METIDRLLAERDAALAEVARLRAALEEVRATGDAWSAAIARDALVEERAQSDSVSTCHETCPECGGATRLTAYDDGDDLWDECVECNICSWRQWL